jgi:hypothetical protein
MQTFLVPHCETPGIVDAALRLYQRFDAVEQQVTTNASQRFL